MSLLAGGVVCRVYPGGVCRANGLYDPRAMTAPVELPLARAAPVSGERPVAAISADRYRELARRVRILSWLSLGAMSVEGVVAIVAGVLAGSIALVGFGLDSAVEGFASVVIIWRFTGSRVLSERAEQRAQRLVALQFFRSEERRVGKECRS